jgi:HlyD family secretion protein
MKPNRKLAIPIIVAVLIAMAFLVFRWVKNGSSHSIHVSGNIELTQVNISFKIPGKMVERLVDEGAFVKKGTTIARLDQQQLLRQREQIQAVLAAATSRLEQLHTAIAYQAANVTGQIEQRQAELNSAQANLRDLLAGSRPQEIENAKAAVDRARAEKTKAEADWQRAQKLFKNDDISASDLDGFRNRFDSTSAQLKQAEEQLALVVEGPRKETIESTRAQVNRAQAGLKLAEAGHLENKRLEQQLRSSKAEIAQAQAQLAVIDTQLQDSVAVTPIDGVVLVKSAEPGEVLAAGTSVVTVGELSRPWLRAYINEQDLGKVKLGGKVKVVTDSYPGKAYDGKVSFIASEAEFTPKQIQTHEERVKLVYRIKIDVENPNQELKTNMPADAEILLD